MSRGAMLEWIRRKKRTLQIILALSIGAALTVLVAFREGAERGAPWMAGLVVLPWLAAVATFLPLMYLAWFGEPRSRAVRVVGMAFFWLLVGVWALIFLQFYGALVFRLWNTRPIASFELYVSG